MSCHLPSAFCRLAEDSHHQRDIRQMRATGKRIVEGDDVTWADLNFAQGRSNGHRHRTEMYGHVIALRDYAA